MRLTVTATLSIVTFMAAHASTGRQAQAQPQDAATMVSEVCSACHGPKGNSPESAYPRLAGQQKDYLEIQLKAFRDRARGGPMAQAYMWTQASRLSDGMIVKLAALLRRARAVQPRPRGFVRAPDRPDDLRARHSLSARGGVHDLSRQTGSRRRGDSPAGQPASRVPGQAARVVQERDPGRHERGADARRHVGHDASADHRGR